MAPLNLCHCPWPHNSLAAPATVLAHCSQGSFGHTQCAHLSQTLVLGLSLGFEEISSSVFRVKATASCCGSHTMAVQGVQALLKADSKFLCLHRASRPPGRVLLAKVMVAAWKLGNEARGLGLIFSMSPDEGSSSRCCLPHRTAAAVAACQLKKEGAFGRPGTLLPHLLLWFFLLSPSALCKVSIWHV